jgi:hypothetical protein
MMGVLMRKKRDAIFAHVEEPEVVQVSLEEVFDDFPVKEAVVEPTKELSGGFDLDKKIAAIEASNLPDSQKAEYLKSLGIGVVKESGVTFSVYAKVRKIEQSRHSAMLAFPKAKGIRLASLEKWDEIFKEF